jgi:hypothetical protein
METLKRCVAAAAGLFLLSLALSMTSVVGAVSEKIGGVFVTNGAANPVPVQVTNPPAVQDVAGTVAVSNFPATQHVAGTLSLLGRPPSEHVTLVHLAPSNAGYVQQSATGQLVAGDFVIPAGQVLVITDIEITFRRGAAEAGNTASYFLETTDPSFVGVAIRARLMATLNAEGNGSDDRHLQTGIVFPSTVSLQDNLSSVASFDVAVLRGYLVAES